MAATKRIAIIGARGYVGRELIQLLIDHAGFELAAVSSRQYAGKPVRDLVPDAPGDLAFETLTPDTVEQHQADAWVLALPNGKAQPWVDAIQSSQGQAVILDLSADYRFTNDWYYGLPELTRTHYARQRLISNPGCYATGMQLALAPLVGLFEAPPVVFGVSGYSGAGTTPSPRNDPALLKDNLVPYAPVGHVHEREVTRHLDYPVHFLPHVAAFFRGIALTIDTRLAAPASMNDILQRFEEFYAAEPLVTISENAPEVKAAAGHHGAAVGGFALSEDGTRLALSATLDNLLKGAATQALQNLNLACDFDELEGIDHG